MHWTLVTGAAKGLGSVIAIELAKAGHNLVIHYRNSEEEAKQIATICQKWSLAEICQGDFSHHEGVIDFTQRYRQKYPSTFGLVNNVGNYLIKPLEQSSLEEWQALFQTNLFTPIFLMNTLSDSLKQNKGRVVTIGTVGLSSPRAFTKAPAYSISKSALYQTMLSYAKAWAKDQVTVNMISPGYMANSVDLGESFLPMGRPAELEEVAKMVVTLFSPESSYITGQNIEIAGAFGL